MRVQVSHSMQQRIPIQVFLFHTVLVRVLYLIPVEGRSVRTASPRPASAQTATLPHDHTAHHSTLPSTRQLSFLPFDFFLSFLLSSLLLPLHHHLVLSHCTSCSHFHISVPRLDPDPSSCSTSSPLPCPAAPRPFNPPRVVLPTRRRPHSPLHQTIIPICLPARSFRDVPTGRGSGAACVASQCGEGRDGQVHTQKGRGAAAYR
jgi:hypothetical protein